jgi:hypothetical protein
MKTDKKPVPCFNSSVPPNFGETFGLGVTGHRPNGLEGSNLPLLHDRVRQVLEIIKRAAGKTGHYGTSASGYPPVAPRINTPLAEGADRIVAEEGLAYGYSLYCPLPFYPHEYEKDFHDEASKRAFRDLLSKAAWIRVMMERFSPGKRHIAYAKSGQEVLRCSSVIVTIWDGNQERGTGGTAEIVGGALASGIPVVWVHATAAHRICLLPPLEQPRPGIPPEILEALCGTFPDYDGPKLFPL